MPCRIKQGSAGFPFWNKRQPSGRHSQSALGCDWWPAGEGSWILLPVPGAITEYQYLGKPWLLVSHSSWAWRYPVTIQGYAGHTLSVLFLYPSCPLHPLKRLGRFPSSHTLPSNDIQTDILRVSNTSSAVAGTWKTKKLKNRMNKWYNARIEIPFSNLMPEVGLPALSQASH